ncbi:MAG: hypothetical protein ACRC11_00705, partial [Xenococcaceae cyanobacterium]
MKILAINCGSSSLKFEIVEVNQDRANATSKLAEGKVENSGSNKGKIKFFIDKDNNLKDETVPVAH